ncbi:MAG: hypothetical protein HZA51_00335 [Planctomycetes bacterium]|nr:hypothetical protein [Planctomycetota bacterium]
MRLARFPSAARRLWVWTIVLFTASAARADIDAWYELTASTGPIGTGVVSVEQGTAGRQLIITTDSTPGTYTFTIKLLADVDLVDALYGYSVDLIAPTAANVEATAFDYLSLMDLDMPILLGAGPGALIDDASQLTFFSPQSGPLELFEFTLTVEQSLPADIELYSGIGLLNWGSANPPAIIRYADADPLDGEVADLVTNRPSIVIRQFQTPPVDPPPVDPPPVNPPPVDPPANDPPAEPPPVNPVPTAETESQTDASHATQTDATSPKAVNRSDLRKMLAMLFNVPMDGVEPMSKWPSRVLGYAGMNLSILWGIGDLAGLPWRMIMFDLTYAVLDAFLP